MQRDTKLFLLKLAPFRNPSWGSKKTWFQFKKDYSKVTAMENCLLLSLTYLTLSTFLHNVHG